MTEREADGAILPAPIVTGGDDGKPEAILPLAAFVDLARCVRTIPPDNMAAPFTIQLDMGTQEYVVGFLVDQRLSRVLLQTKNRPDWQAGRLNGPGGKIKPGETPAQAMAREFVEETGWSATWGLPRLVVDGPGWRVHYFVARVVLGDLWTARKTAADLAPQDPKHEACDVYQLDRLPDNVLPGLRWQIPLCLDEDVESAWVVDGTRLGRGRTRAAEPAAVESRDLGPALL